MFDEKLDFTEKAKAREVTRFKSKTNIDKRLEIITEVAQDVEDVLFRLLHERALSTAVGVNLDGLGENFGPQGLRNGRSDAQYRTALQVLPAQLREAGQHEVLISALKNLTGASAIHHAYHYPRALTLLAVVDSFDDVTNKEDVEAQMQSIRAQGVNLDIALKLSTGSFELSTQPDGSVPIGTGFSLSTAGEGGTLSLLLS